jgi:hypothetical protein
LGIFLVEEVDIPTIQQPEIIEQIIKSPPEPTRVKSPEQIVIMRSPDPVFWTVPLDTGKTFTVTQNVREGDVANIVRPHSEIKVQTPSEAPRGLLPQEHPQSAPPELWEGEKLECKFKDFNFICEINKNFPFNSQQPKSHQTKRDAKSFASLQTNSGKAAIRSSSSRINFALLGRSRLSRHQLTAKCSFGAKYRQSGDG